MVQHDRLNFFIPLSTKSINLLHMESRVSFGLVSFSAVIVLNILKRRKNRRKVKYNQDLKEYLDWIEASNTDVSGTDEISRRASLDSFVSAEEDSGNVIFRALASLGMAPTSPKQGRVSRDRTSERPYEHPATGNDEMADEVVRLKRISQEEEIERYFSGFSRA